jgi:hypothetical protein
MIRVVNFFCVALMGLSILGLYHVSERTRVAKMELTKVTRQIREAHGAIGVLQTEWARVAGPGRVQALALRYGMQDTTSAQLSSFELLPRRGDAPLNNSPLRNANAQVAQNSAATVRPTLSPQAISQISGY